MCLAIHHMRVNLRCFYDIYLYFNFDTCGFVTNFVNFWRWEEISTRNFAAFTTYFYFVVILAWVVDSSRDCKTSSFLCLFCCLAQKEIRAIALLLLGMLIFCTCKKRDNALFEFCLWSHRQTLVWNHCPIFHRAASWLVEN